MNEWNAGEVAGAGTFHCVSCEYRVSLNATDEMPVCPRCYGTVFVRSSFFAELPTARSEVAALPTRTARARWIEEVRAGLDLRGQHVAYPKPGGDYGVFRLRKTWTRIGRSPAAHIRFDDPTVSRRHGLIVHQPDGFHLLDDRSLNGIFVNGERVEWTLLRGGDEILIGRHRLGFIDAGASTRARRVPPRRVSTELTRTLN